MLKEILGALGSILFTLSNGTQAQLRIPTLKEIVLGTKFHGLHCGKLTPDVLLDDGEASS